MSAKPLMVLGTMSNAGKSLLCAGLCRVFAQDGFSVAPFKSQNMALNSYVTPDGLEIGRAQALQAQACGIEPSALMNPILLKPESNHKSQVIVNGRARATMPAREYFGYKKALIPEIRAAYEALAAQVDIVVVEGAGSPAEINLAKDDIVNLGLARMIDAPALLVGDIDPGGVFAQLYGTVSLLENDARARVKGLVINKFRGDASLLEPGLDQLEDLCGVPVVGIVPYTPLDLEDEDSLSSRLDVRRASGVLDVAVVRLPHLSNFTDFDALGRHPAVGLRYVDKAECLGIPDLVILPGTKSTRDDARWLEGSDFAACVSALARAGSPILGICGGYQLLGELSAGPNDQDAAPLGLGLLPVRTSFGADKQLSRTELAISGANGVFAAWNGLVAKGYEIHEGQTLVDAYSLGVACGSHGAAQNPEGCCVGNVCGSYLHGIFDEPVIVDALVGSLLERRGLSGSISGSHVLSAREHREVELDRLAAVLRESLDLTRIYSILEAGA